MIEYKECNNLDKSGEMNSQLLPFGWKVESTTFNKPEAYYDRYIGATQLTNPKFTVKYSRDTEMDNYKELKELEVRYRLGKIRMNELSKPARNNLVLALLIILGIIPGIVYAIIKNKKQKELDNEYKKESMRCFTILEKAKLLSNYKENY